MGKVDHKNVKIDLKVAHKNVMLNMVLHGTETCSDILYDQRGFHHEIYET